jgi:hypothetical protein
VREQSKQGPGGGGYRVGVVETGRAGGTIRRSTIAVDCDRIASGPRLGPGGQGRLACEKGRRTAVWGDGGGIRGPETSVRTSILARWIVQSRADLEESAAKRMPFMFFGWCGEKSAGPGTAGAITVTLWRAAAAAGPALIRPAHVLRPCRSPSRGRTWPSPRRA